MVERAQHGKEQVWGEKEMRSTPIYCSIFIDVYDSLEAVRNDRWLCMD
jgi:hypothetical protein